MMKKILVMIGMFCVLASLVVASNVSDNNSVDDVVIEDVNDTLPEELEENVSDEDDFVFEVPENESGDDSFVPLGEGFSEKEEGENSLSRSYRSRQSRWRIFADYVGGFLKFKNYGWENGSSFSNIHLVIDTDGNVGIGTESPTEKLEINGSVSISEAMRLKPLSDKPENPSNGDMFVFDTGVLCVYLEGIWEVVAGSGFCKSWSEMSKITASDGAGYDSLGYSVSIDGDYAVVGAWRDNDDGDMSGSVYVFKRNGTNWIEQTKLTASDGAARDYFGRSVSINGDYVVVGAPGDDSLKGSAYIFKRDGASWSEEAKLTASDGVASDYFGMLVSISGDYAVVGAWGDDDSGISSGSAYIFKKNGTNWTEQTKITASDGAKGDRFGYSVSIDGDYVVVGAYFDDDGRSNSGSAYIFKNNGTSWSQEAKLTASDGARNDNFGWSVSIDGDYAVVGAWLDDDSGSNSGSAYIFKRNGTSWSEEAKLTASEGAAEDYFGQSVSIDGDYAVVGAYLDDDNGAGSGSAYIFRRDGASWSEEAKLTASEGAAEDYFGQSVSIDGDYVVVGANQDDDSGYNSGSAYIYELS